MTRQTVRPAPLMTPSEVARLFRVTPRTVTRWAKAERLHPVRTPLGHRRYREAEVMAFYNGTGWTQDGGAS